MLLHGLVQAPCLSRVGKLAASDPLLGARAGWPPPVRAMETEEREEPQAEPEADQPSSATSSGEESETSSDPLSEYFVRHKARGRGGLQQHLPSRLLAPLQARPHSLPLTCRSPAHLCLESALPAAADQAGHTCGACSALQCHGAVAGWCGMTCVVRCSAAAEVLGHGGVHPASCSPTLYARRC